MYIVLGSISFNTDVVDVITVEYSKSKASVVMYAKGNKYTLHSIDNSVMEDTIGANPILIAKYLYDTVMKISAKHGLTNFIEMESRLNDVIEEYLQSLTTNESYINSVNYIVSIRNLNGQDVTEEKLSELRKHMKNIEHIEKLKRNAAYREIERR